VRARVPASSANLGPGFDTLGVALSLYTQVTITPSDRLQLEVRGEGSGFPKNGTHFAAKLARQILGHDRLRIQIESEVPVSRGLGSSAALAVAVVAACGHPDPLTVVGLLEGHADNAAACVLGGFVTATIIDGKVVASRLPLDPDLTFVAIIPDQALSTKEARLALPASVPLSDAVFNLGRMGAVIAGLGDHRQLRPEAMADRLHQGQRAPLFPASTAILRALVEAGALASCWSGAGPTLLAVCHRDTVEQVCNDASAAMATAGVEGRAVVLAPDPVGLVVTQ
jgi:homoserine kinase